MFKELYKEICNMSNLLFGLLVLSIQIMICSLVVTIGTVSINDDLVKEVIDLKYQNTLLDGENTQCKYELDQVDQMICNNEVQNVKESSN